VIHEPTSTTSGAYSMQENALLAYEAMDGSDDIVLLIESSIGTDGVVVGANGAFCRATGYAEEQLVSREIAELFLIEDDARTLVKAIQNRTAVRGEFACARGACGTFMLGLHLMLAPPPASGLACMIMLGRDISAAVETR
jgi:PAS domain S-box-containing protein